MFFINLTKKFLRVAGYIVCGLLLCATILLVVCAAAFGSRNTVDVFGVNIYIVQSDGYDKAPKGSAVLVQKTTAYDLSEGKLVLYTTGSEVNECALGYVKNIYVVDGQYYVTVTDGSMTSEIAETRLIGRADYSSKAVGAVISFVKTPFGVFCVAVLPCIALILYDIIKTAASRLPDPEVEPQYKNYADETGNLAKAAQNRRSISVSSDGKATYSRSKVQNASDGNPVLFSYEGQRSTGRQRPIIPLSDKTYDNEMRSSEKVSVRKPEDKPRLNPASIAPDATPETPEKIALGKYIANVESTRSAADDGTDKPNGKTAEIQGVAKHSASDAFFAQTTTSSLSRGLPTANNAPQIGRQISRHSSSQQNKDGANASASAAHSSGTAGKRSSQILASKRVEDLIDDDDDIRSKKRITNSMVDDIMSDIKKIR